MNKLSRGRLWGQCHHHVCWWSHMADILLKKSEMLILLLWWNSAHCFRIQVGTFIIITHPNLNPTCDKLWQWIQCTNWLGWHHERIDYLHGLPKSLILEAVGNTAHPSNKVSSGAHSSTVRKRERNPLAFQLHPVSGHFQGSRLGNGRKLNCTMFFYFSLRSTKAPQHPPPHPRPRSLNPFKQQIKSFRLSFLPSSSYAQCFQ